LAVSKKLIPRSIARSIISSDSSCGSVQSHASPKLIQPRQMRETSIPVVPSVVYSIRTEDRPTA